MSTFVRVLITRCLSFCFVSTAATALTKPVEPSPCARAIATVKSWTLTVHQVACFESQPGGRGATATLCTPARAGGSTMLDRYRAFEAAYAAAVDALMTSPNAARASANARDLSVLESEWVAAGDREQVDRVLRTIDARSAACPLR